MNFSRLKITIIVFLLISVATISSRAQAQDTPDVLVYRFGWANGFCFSGSSNGVPKEFCGLEPPALHRFNAHRAYRISYSKNGGGVRSNCTTTSPYDPAAISKSVKAALHCMDNSYNATRGSDDRWNEFVWQVSGSCVEQNTGMTPKTYFRLLVDAFKRYNVDKALKSAGYDFSTPQTVDPNAVVDALEKAFGYRGFYTCDPGTGTNWSTFSICLTTTAPYNITACPSKLLKPDSKCPTSVQFATNHSVPVTPKCRKFYPSIYGP